MDNKRLRDAADQVFRTTRFAARRDLEADCDGSKVHELLANAHRMTDTVIGEAVQADPAAGRPVCCEGCTACCYLHVVAFPLEVLAIAKQLRDQMNPEHLADIIQKMDVHIAKTAGLDASERRHARVACPLLEAGRCEIYSYRPISCRGWNSLDRAVCDADLANPAANTTTPVNISQFVLGGRVAEGLGAASHSLGLDSRPLDFVRALRVAVEDPDAVAKAWRTGLDEFGQSVNENVFPGLKSSEEDDARTALWERE